MHAGEKNVATGLSDPMWITNVCLLLAQQSEVIEYFALQRICRDHSIGMPLQIFL